MRFIDRTLQEIDERKWRQLYGDAKYRVVAERKGRDIRVECVWVGVWLSHESRARPFCVDVCWDSNTTCSRRLPRCRWYATQEDALDAYERMCDEVFSKPREAG